MDGLLLEIVEGPDSGKQIALSGPISIGRDPECTLLLTDELASRHHVSVDLRNGSAVAADLGSVNGTFLNGVQLHGETPFAPGDHLLVGVTVVELRRQAELTARPTAVRPRPAAFAVPESRPGFVPAELEVPSLGTHERRLEALLDVRTKHRARLAPLGLALLVTIAVILFLTLR